MTRRNWAWLIVGLGLSTVFVLVTYAVLDAATTTSKIRGTQQTNAPKIDNTEQTLRLVKDCVTPGGTCYERGQRQTAKAVGDIAATQIAAASYAASCAAQGLAKPDAIYDCVMREFDKHKD